jgi:hypothetical protein
MLNVADKIYTLPDYTLQKIRVCIPRTETAWPRSQFLHSYIHVSVSDLYIPRIGLPLWLQKNCSQMDECVNWEKGHYNFGLEITRPRSFISGNT